MKIRNGFVSNSSSSSFIINYHDCDKKVTKEELKKIMEKLIEIEKTINKDIKFEDVFTLDFNPDDMCIGEAKNIIEARKDWEKDDEDRVKTDYDKCKGKIIINSVDDNSIPFWMGEFFEDELGAKRWHWG